LPILDVVIHPLPYTESTAQRVTYPRGAIAVTVRGPDGGTLRFVSTHFQHNVAEDRVAEASAINRLFCGDNKLPTILAGDMNAVPDSEPIRELLKHWSNATDKPASPTAPSKQPALIMLGWTESHGHVRQFSQPPRLVNTTGSLHTHVHFLERDQIRLRFVDHICEAIYIVLPVVALTVVDVVTQDTQARRFGGTGKGAGIEKGQMRQQQRRRNNRPYC
jgi:hypothetical protein